MSDWFLPLSTMISLRTDHTVYRPRSRWYQFSLRKMLLAVIPCALGAAVLAEALRRDDTVRLTITDQGIVLHNGKCLPSGLSSFEWLKELKDDLKYQCRRRASERPGSYITARIDVDGESPYSNVKRAIWGCQIVGIEHFVFRSVGKKMTMFIPPLQPCEGQPNACDLPPICVRLRAAEDGSVASIRLGDRPLANFAALNRTIRDILGDDTGPGSVADATTVLLDCSDGLRFKHVVEAYLAVSRRVCDDGTVRPLARDVRFHPALDAGCSLE